MDKAVKACVALIVLIELCRPLVYNECINFEWWQNDASSAKSSTITSMLYNLYVYGQGRCGTDTL